MRARWSCLVVIHSVMFDENHTQVITTNTSDQPWSMVVKGWVLGLFCSHWTETCSNCYNQKIHFIQEYSWDKCDAICPAASARKERKKEDPKKHQQNKHLNRHRRKKWTCERSELKLIETLWLDLRDLCMNWCPQHWPQLLHKHLNV